MQPKQERGLLTAQTSEQSRKILSELDRMESEGTLQHFIKAGIISLRIVRARKTIRLVDLAMKVHGYSKTKAVKYVSETTGSPVRYVWRDVSFFR